MSEEKPESVNREFRERVLLALSRECGPRERERERERERARWIRGDESCKLTI